VIHDLLNRLRDFYGPLAARDGFVIVAPVNQRNFEQLADAVGQPGWKSDPRFATPKARTANWDALMEGTGLWTKTRSARSCEDILMKAGVPCSRYLTVAEAIADPQIAARGTMAEAEDGAGRFMVPNPPFQFADGSVKTGRKVPLLGEHTRGLLKDVLGMESGEISGLIERAVISGG